MEHTQFDRDYILCVDDEQSVLNQLFMQLCDAFQDMCSVESAESAEEALTLMEELTRSGKKILVVISDQVMPGMHGDRFLEVVHQQYPATKKILLTGYAGLESAMYAINNAGLDQYCEKPWDREKLMRVIGKLIDDAKKGTDEVFRIEKLLRNVQLFRNLPSDAITLIAEKLQPVRFQKDDPIFRIDDLGDCMYIIKSGEVKVIAGVDENDEVLAYLGHGNYFGEMALLTSEPRSASVVASLDSEVLMLTKADFDFLIDKHPSITVALSHVLSQRLRDVSVKKAGRQHKIICLLNSLSDQRERKIVASLSRKMRQETNGKLVVIDLDRSGSQRPALHTQQDDERDSPWIIQNLDHIQDDDLNAALHEDASGVSFFLPPSEDEYPLSSYIVPLLGLLKEFYNFILVHVKTSRASADHLATIMEQADTLLYIVEQHESTLDKARRFLSELEQSRKQLLKKFEILVVREEVLPDAFKPLTPFLKPSHLHFLSTGRLTNVSCADRQAVSAADEELGLMRNNFDVGRIARRLGNVSIGVVLGGGGARAYAHLGMLKVFQEEGIPVDSLAGTSMGAFLGALFIMGKSVEEILKLSQEAWRKLNSPLSWTLPLIAFIKEHRIRHLVHEIFGEMLIEELPIPFFCVAGDLVSGQEVVMGSGKLYEAILASGALPGFFVPVTRDDMYLVDGGVVNNVPGDVLKKQRIDMVIAVDVTPEREVHLRPREGQTLVSQTESTLPYRMLKMARRLRARYGTMLLPRIIMRVIAIEGLEITRTKSQYFDMHIKPNLEDFDLFDFKRLPEIVAIGEEAGRREVKNIRKTIELLKQ
ncbi:hypothetical protein CSB45_06440 [candidate division KSB3 bacterium]|uniref:Patatin n=1 Tax=candidate division KSB3 bacterium TaxID=2044937 RepID=A0A2G6E6Y2_9BACT|nr:MAG: hypothetical protein CSB45_06440 [candidate division KSB3 bacterium]PIE30279.1 MAG: hypothetical protein CSA57_05155 [candidate division KSB3 bacterium]